MRVAAQVIREVTMRETCDAPELVTVDLIMSMDPAEATGDGGERDSTSPRQCRVRRGQLECASACSPDGLGGHAQDGAVDPAPTRDAEDPKPL